MTVLDINDETKGSFFRLIQAPAEMANSLAQWRTGSTTVFGFRSSEIAADAGGDTQQSRWTREVENPFDVPTTVYRKCIR